MNASEGKGVITGLDPVIHPLRKNSMKRISMDTRIKPAYDDT